MVVPTLPVIGVTPPIIVFITLEWLAFSFVYALLVAAIVSFGVMWTSHCRRIPMQCGPRSYRRLKTLFLFVGRMLCVHTFPALFKIHKTRSGHGSQMRKFMVFLDRKVERSLTLIAAFCSIVYSIFCSSTMVFLRYFPVEGSEEWHKKDSHGRSLFCYSTSRNSSLPVDCAEYSVTELQELDFDCYAIVLPTGLGIAVAAALGLAKVAIVGITIFVKFSEGYFNMTKNDPPPKVQKWCCGGSRKRAIRIYIVLSIAFLVIASLVTSLFGPIFLVVYATTDPHLLHLLYYLAYMILPMLISVPLGYIIYYLEAHCDKGEYASFAADQKPLDPRDWDVESESSMTAGQEDEANMDGEGDNISGEAHDSLLTETITSDNLRIQTEN